MGGHCSVIGMTGDFACVTISRPHFSWHCCGSTPEASNAQLKKSIGRSEKTASAMSYNLGQQHVTAAALRAETSGQQHTDT